MIEVTTLIAFAAMVTFIVTSPGPNLFLVIRNTLGSDQRTGLITTLGICSAILCHALLSLLGVGAIIASSDLLLTVMKLIGAGYLIWLGVKSLKAAIQRVDAPNLEAAGAKTTAGRSAFLSGFVTNAFNPKPALFYLAAFPQFLSTEGNIWLQGLTLGVLHALIAFLWYGGLSAAFDVLGPSLKRVTVWKAIQGISGLALLVFGIRLMLTQTPR